MTLILSPAQREVVAHRGGALQVVACAGAGKTEAISRRNDALRPRTPRKLFVNIAVADLQRSIAFFEALGFAFNRHFTDAQGTCMLVGEDAYVMLLTPERFATFSHRPMVDASERSEALFTFAVESREAVDAIVRTAAAHGGAVAGTPEDHGFMYDWSFFDPDGHQ